MIVDSWISEDGQWGFILRRNLRNNERLYVLECFSDLKPSDDVVDGVRTILHRQSKEIVAQCGYSVRLCGIDKTLLIEIGSKNSEEPVNYLKKLLERWYDASAGFYNCSVHWPEIERILIQLGSATDEF